jgi:hypothetical protein
MVLNNFIYRTAIALGLIGFVFSGAVFAAKTVNTDVNPSSSTGGVNYNIDGVNAVYQYTIYDGQAVNDTIPVQVCMTGSETGWTSIGVTFGTQAGPLPGVTPPAIQTFLSSATIPDCRTVSITIATGALNLTDPNVTQNFNANFNLSDTSPQPSTGSNKPQVSWTDVKNYQIKVTVLPATSNVSCFLTDSEGNFLTKCDGTPVTESGSDEGRFAIVANKKNIEVATNPGQLYYNLVWFNSTGSAHTVNVNFSRTGLSPQGRQAIHAALFNGYMDPMTQTDFAAANEYGVPEGSDDKVLGINVPAGNSLLVTYHLEWTGVGLTVPLGCTNNCDDANQTASVTGTVSGTGITAESCTATAYGYKK